MKKAEFLLIFTQYLPTPCFTTALIKILVLAWRPGHRRQLCMDRGVPHPCRTRAQLCTFCQKAFLSAVGLLALPDPWNESWEMLCNLCLWLTWNIHCSQAPTHTWRCRHTLPTSLANRAEIHTPRLSKCFHFLWASPPSFFALVPHIS